MLKLNDAFRQLLREPRWCSASRLFALNNVSSFAALMSKLMYSLLSSLCKCNNSFIHAMMNSDIYFQSPVFKRWRSTLY